MNLELQWKDMKNKSDGRPQEREGSISPNSSKSGTKEQDEKIQKISMGE